VRDVRVSSRALSALEIAELSLAPNYFKSATVLYGELVARLRSCHNLTFAAEHRKLKRRFQRMVSLDRRPGGRVPARIVPRPRRAGGKVFST